MPTYQLGVSATYHTEGDLIVANVYLYDPATEVYPIQLVNYGVANLLSGGVQIDSSVEFDKRFGTSKGNFQVFFVHPSSLHDLSVTVDLSVINGTVEDPYHFETQVIHVQSEDTGLEAQPQEHEGY